PKNLDLRFKAEWLIEESCSDDVLDYEAIGIGIDLSASLRETADYTVFVLIGRLEGKYYVLDMRRGRWAGNLDKCWVLLGLLLDWGVIRLKESVTYKLNDYQVPEFNVGTLTPQDLYSPLSQVSLHVESKSYEISFEQDWIGFCSEYHLSQFVIWPDKDRADKLLKLKSVTGMFQRGEVVFDSFSDFSYLFHELKHPLQTEHDDCLDSLVLGLRGMKEL
ncbi:MAG: hypothetical protein ACO3YX_07285, partial [Candidatus Nanopelagicaceae bacterium]